VNGLDLKKGMTKEDLKKAPAFQGAFPDGRQCIAWAEMIVELKKLDAEILCFDLNMIHKQERKAGVRDSVMFRNINDYLAKDTSKMFVALTGNISNMLIPNKNKKTLGCYLSTDSSSCLKGKKMLSLNYFHGKGTMMNWKNAGYLLREEDSNAEFFEAACSYENFLLVYPVMKGYDGIFFTRSMTASGPLVETK